MISFMTLPISQIVQHGVFRRLVVEELDIFVVKTSLSDQFHIL
jgi:hypothetical protein